MIGDEDFKEVDWQEGARVIDDCKYLFAIEVSEISELTLRLLLTEAKTQPEVFPRSLNPELAEIFSGGQPIEADESCRRFEVIFDRRGLISYSVLNESYGRYPEAPEVFCGKLFRVFETSHLLNFVRTMTYASDEHPGPLHHYEIACLNHVFDIISTTPPRVSIANPASANRYGGLLH